MIKFLIIILLILMIVYVVLKITSPTQPTKRLYSDKEGWLNDPAEFWEDDYKAPPDTAPRKNKPDEFV